MATAKLLSFILVIAFATIQMEIFYVYMGQSVRLNDRQFVAKVQNVSNSIGYSHLTYAESMKQVRELMAESMHRFDRKLNLPLMALRPEEQNKEFRVREARKWLKTQKLVVGASVRNAMAGLESSVRETRKLTELFHSVTSVFVENDSSDDTRKYLHSLTKQNSKNFTVYLLGCGTINSLEPCRINITYQSGRKHVPGNMEGTGRTLQEESVDRGLVMAAMRNHYLNFIYSNISADLLLVLEVDIGWLPWKIDSIAQALYYFKAKPRLDSLCTLTYSTKHRHLQDPCTIVFFHNKHFYVDAQETASPFSNRYGKHNDVYKKQFAFEFLDTETSPRDPVKVAACFQGAAFYRMSSMLVGPVFYRYSEGEWHCEHTTLSTQLRENYLDMQMRLDITH